MAAVSLHGLTRVYGSIRAVDGIDLQIADGEFVTLVGPSGCGKTTTLNIVAGLDRPTSGDVRFGDRNVTDLPTERRDIAMVFQTYALYPHMTVLQNITFGLINRGMSRKQAEERARVTAERLDLTERLDRRPRELSGGQRQRVALARALVRQAAIYLLDEPLSNLDARLRVSMRSELKRLHYEVAGTFLYVTHDQMEALTLSDRIAVMSNGKIEQLGTPAEIYEFPASVFVAGFMGSPQINLFDAVIAGGGLNWGGARLRLPSWIERSNAGKALRAGIRAEDLRQVPNAGEGVISGEISLIEPVGSDTYVTVETPGGGLIARMPAGNGVRRGDIVHLEPNAERLHLFEAETGRTVRN